MGVDYKYAELNEKMLGLTVVFECKPIILINSSLVDSNKRFEVMAHELSHALCHVDLPLTYGFAVNGRIKLESEADDFAAHLLTGFYIQEFGEIPKSFAEIQNAFMLDEDAIEYYV
jgi:Zn-dependent peptidase ImmA (M78 family)